MEALGNHYQAGWRPFLGWGASLGLLWSTVGAPLVTWMATLAGYSVDAPAIPSDLMLELVLVLLGVSGLRSFEKVKGVAGGAQRPTTAPSDEEVRREVLRLMKAALGQPRRTSTDNSAKDG